MAYLHCHTCGWEQDDFWNEVYNPLTSPGFWVKQLLSPDRDKQFSDDAEFLREYGPISTREVIAQDLEKCAKRVRQMFICTREEWRAIKEKPPCPQCGDKNWDID